MPAHPLVLSSLPPSVPLSLSVYLDAAGDRGRNFDGHPLEDGRVDAHAALAGEGLPAQLEEDAPVFCVCE